jgi:hypothetical protein
MPARTPIVSETARNHRPGPSLFLLGHDYSSLDSHLSTELEEYQRTLGIVKPQFRLPDALNLHLSRDDSHLNARGYRILAREMLLTLTGVRGCLQS